MLFEDRSYEFEQCSVPARGTAGGSPSLLEELGASLDDAFCRLWYRARGTRTGCAFLAIPILAALLERSAVVARCPHLGLLIGARNDHRSLGRIGEMMASAPTLGDAFRDYVGLQIGYSRGAVVYLQNAGDDALIGYGLIHRRRIRSSDPTIVSWLLAATWCGR